MVCDRKWLEVQIVRMGEKYPDRVGIPRNFRDKQENTCILGQIWVEAGAKDWPGEMFYAFGNRTAEEVAVCNLASGAARLNNEGVPWGQIPKMLGLVPGESTVEAPAELVEV